MIIRLNGLAVLNTTTNSLHGYCMMKGEIPQNSALGPLLFLIYMNMRITIWDQQGFVVTIYSYVDHTRPPLFEQDQVQQPLQV